MANSNLITSTTRREEPITEGDIANRRHSDYLNEVTRAINENVAKANFEATVNPGATDDETEGYSAGSRWLNTASNTFFQCADATTGAAIWV